MMKEKCEVLLNELKAKLEVEESVEASSIQRLRACLALVADALSELKAVAVEKGFASADEEISFFKSVKPAFYSELIYATERYGFENSRPVLAEDFIGYCNEQLLYISRFFRQHEFLYQYYRLGATELDLVYFVRGVAADGILSLGVPDLDPSFATAGDYLFSKFMGLERMQGYILSMRSSGAGWSVVGGVQSVVSKKGRELRWTGDSTNLIELLYGVFETKQVNDGNIDISDLVDIFEQVFHANLSNYFRRFTTIKRRKSVSKTRFLDEMREAVAKRIDDADAYVPAWAK